MNEKLYDILKYVGRIVLPALASAILSLADVWHIMHATEIAQTLVIIATLLNALLQIDSNQYFKKNAIVSKNNQ